VNQVVNRALNQVRNKLAGVLKFGDKLNGIGIQTYQRRVHHLLKRFHIVVFIGGFASGKTYLAAREVWFYTARRSFVCSRAFELLYDKRTS